ncbi:MULTISPECIES: DEAD/DEAH box helicase [unclassified Microbacterium]|uniref:DEAD/DEAH box helicase n=1 Tax=unclassified Microbacterium TaxID=2609290 RepID=UPI00214AB9A2|nr:MULTISPECIES: DEAD/DEAH box helicase [unclassified Microbacterium]MCR2784653.1 DEAD/DEAH box helicase [Microbacterium sp. zg.B96]WIM16195.1 DEAD/DEAH box helicase [Microbacterium sp. zg-B96]
MPKSKKPAGGRPAKNFEPRYGAKTSYQDRKRQPGDASTGTTGSKSPSHRGYRPDTAATGEAPKRRWTAQEKVGREEARTIRTHSQGDDRPRRSFDDRPARPVGDRPQRDDRGFRGDRVARDERRPTGDGRPSYRPERSSDDRPARAYSDRPQRDDRPARSYSDRPQRDDRPARSFSDRPQRDDRPARSFSDRPARDDRPTRSFSDRPARTFDERPRRDAGDRPQRDDRPARSYSDRPQRDDRPVRSFSDRPARSFDDRPRRDSGDRPARSFDDRPRRDSNDRPARPDWNAETKSKAHQDNVDVVHERLQAEAVQAGEVADVTFSSLGLGDNIVRVLADLGAPTPFPIQAATITPILEGKDVLARGRTGSGKTIAFGAPLVESLLRSQAGKRREFGRLPKALVLAPTRELALQIDRTIQPIARSVGIFTTQIYGGVPQARQVGALKKGVDIIIGTPGRIEDLVAQGKLNLSEVQIVVLDEADHMSELGFLEPMQRILRLVADGAQKLMFSATLDREVAALVDEFLVEPAVYEVAGEDQDSSTINHRILVIDHRDKAEILNSLVDRAGKTLVFARTRAYAEMLAEQFDDLGISAVALHGDLNQAKRTRNLQRLTDGRVNVLVATDVAARGIHVDDIDLVIQADAPDEYKTYLHRSGRTGRAGRVGTVVTLIPRQRRRRMTEMLERAEIDAPFDEVRVGDDILEELAGRQLAEVDA